MNQYLIYLQYLTGTYGIFQCFSGNAKRLSAENFRMSR
ncbi:Uncharacterised protein [Salmonella enterica subsp. enterica]|nr:Uncharacterised protein [Salmonella enterica subsp. enterica]